MQPPVPAPAATPLVAQTLTQALSGVRVSTQKPATPPDRFVLLSLIGGDPDTFATVNPRFLVECYASDSIKAEQFVNQVAHAWRSLRAHNRQLGHSYTDRIVDFDDPDDRYHRFQFTAGITILLNHI